MNNARQRQYLEAMGIPVWVRRDVQPLPLEGEMPPGEPTRRLDEAVAESLTAVSRDQPSAGASMVDGLSASTDLLAPPLEEEASQVIDWPLLRARVEGCARCPELVKTRTQAVFGSGSETAEWMVIGAAPGAEEEQQGEFFVGPVGLLLTNMLKAVGLARGAVYTTGVAKCRTTSEGESLAAAAAQCQSHLQGQLRLLKPRLILLLGEHAAQSLLGLRESLDQLRGKVHRHTADGSNIDVVVTYHPADLLQCPANKRKAWDDLRLAAKVWREQC